MRKIDRVLEEMNGGLVGFRVRDQRVLFKAVARTVTPASGWISDDGTDVDFIILTRKWRAQVQEVGTRIPPVFLQTDERWADLRYSPESRLTFDQAGCLVCTAASLAAWAGYDVDPVSFAGAIAEKGAFSGGNLGHPSAVARAFPKLTWHLAGDRVYWSPKYQQRETSRIDWGDRPADVGCLGPILEAQPVPIKVDYKPNTRPIDQHFVLAYCYIPDPNGGLNDDLLVMDPMSGRTSALTYFNPDWLNDWMKREGVTRVERLLMGARVWDIQD